MKILLGAWACNPRHGSEAAVGWTWLTALAAIKDRHDIHVLTARYQRDWIEAEVSNQPDRFTHVRFHYVEPPLWPYDDTSAFWRWQANKPLLLPLFHRYYHRWLRAAYKTACDLNRRFHFDLVHQLTFVGFRFPGHLGELGIPFVWGPIGGLENMPWRLVPVMGFRGGAYYAARNIVNSWHKRFLPAPRKAFGRASAVIAATSGIQSEIHRCYGVPSQVISEVGIPIEAAPRFATRAPGEPLRIAWSGLHLPGKALQLLLRALHAIPESVDWCLEIWGDGPCRRRWQSMASRLRIDARCTWHGQVSRDEALRGLRRAHLFVITSLKDLTSTVIIEALAQGVPVICPDHCGFSDAVTDECGIKLPIRSAGEFEQGLAGAIADLASDEQRRRWLAAGALRRARAYSIEAKAAAIELVYRDALEHYRARVNASEISRDGSAHAGTEAPVVLV